MKGRKRQKCQSGVVKKSVKRSRQIYCECLLFSRAKPQSRPPALKCARVQILSFSTYLFRSFFISFSYTIGLSPYIYLFSLSPCLSFSLFICMSLSLSIYFLSLLIPSCYSLFVSPYLHLSHFLSLHTSSIFLSRPVSLSPFSRSAHICFVYVSLLHLCLYVPSLKSLLFSASSLYPQI